MLRYRTISAALLLAASLLPVHAEEGMWTFDNVPVDKIAKAYGFRPDQRWLDHVRLSSVRLAGGCSAAFVSPNGLVQTNHHCARSCIQQLSTATKDFSVTGFYAREIKDEVKCPEIEVNQLIDIRDVTDRVRKSTDGKDGQAFADAMKAAKAAIAHECSGNDENIRCDVVELYKGGIYNLYKYRRYQDVRLVFTPEDAIADFGGDPDNFEFPRYALDLTFLRVYRDGVSLDSRTHFLRYAAADAKAGELTFTSGHPWETFRLQTAEHLEFWRDRIMPLYFFQESELRGMLTAFSMRGAEQARIARDKLLEIENTLKADKGATPRWSIRPSSGIARPPNGHCAPRSMPMRHCAHSMERCGTI
jgi:Peptidase S46